MNMPGLTDSHAHLTSEEFAPDLDGVLERAREAGVTRIVIPATHEVSSREALALAGRHRWLFAAVGIHPHEAARVSEQEIEAVHHLTAAPGVVAVGEIGLDYFYDFAPRDVQVALFRRQMGWAVERDLPVIVHTRESMEEAIAIALEMAALHPSWCRRGEESHRGVFHCFTGTEQQARQLIEAGYYVSFPGMVTFKKSPVADLIPRLGLDRVLIETDAPYLTPAPHRGQRNEPAYVAFVANTLAAMLHLTPEVVASRTSINAQMLFRFPSATD
jgi:TatD DNase family protein